jgi:hypothetical protein
MMEGGDENSAKDVGKVIAVLTRLAKPHDAATMFVHHTTKDGDAERGSTSLRGASDMMAALKPSGGGVFFECTKMKNWEEFNPFLLSLAKVADSCVFVLGSQDDEFGEREMGFLRDCQTAFGSDWATSKQQEDVTGLKEKTFFRTRKALLTRAFLEDNGKEYRPHYRLTEKGIESLKDGDCQ